MGWLVIKLASASSVWFLNTTTLVPLGIKGDLGGSFLVWQEVEPVSLWLRPLPPQFGS